MSSGTDFSGINEAKATMDHIYDRRDPRAYFATLKKLNYSIPSTAKPIFQKMVSHLRRQRDEETLCVLDIGCSYGVNAALLKHDLSMSNLYEHWGQARLADATPEEVKRYDQRYFDNLDETENLKMIGIDQAENAIAFAEETGLLDEGLALDLETETLPAAAKEELEPVDLLISTGCVGYVTEKSFEQLLPAVTQDSPAWVANFVLRMFPYDPIEDVLESWGYATEKLEGQTFRQRRFASTEEQEQVLGELSDRNIDPTDNEADGYLVAEFYLSRPKTEVAELPIERLLAT